MLRRLNKVRPPAWAAVLVLMAAPAVAQIGVYQTKDEFLEATFESEPPKSGVIWFNDELRALATEILGHPPAMLRMRYWYEGGRTAWIIDEIGKEKPITLGVVIEGNAIRRLSVLQFRETRGWEIRYPFFTKQFDAVQLNKRGELNQRIDGITGATLSVRAAKRSANLALVLNEHIRQPTEKTAAAP